SAGGDLQLPTVQGQSVMHLAASHDGELLLPFLLEQGLKLEAMDTEGRTPLHLAAASGCPESVETLGKLGSGLETRDVHGMTAFDVALFNGEMLTLEVLLNLGAKATIASLGIAAERGSLAALKQLIEREPSFRTSDKRSLLHLATAHRDATLIPRLVEKGVPTEVRDGNGATPLHAAGFENNPDAVRALFAAGAAAKVEDIEGRNPLHYLGDTAQPEVVQALLDGGVSYHAPDKQGVSAFALALQSERTHALKALAPAYPPREDDVEDDSGWSEAHHAACFGSTAAIACLVARGTLAQKDSQGWTVLHQATFDGVVAALEQLVAAGLSVESTSDAGERPIHVATNEEAVKALLRHHADVNARDAAGNTALHLAITRGFQWLFEPLHRAGARWDVPNAQGETARQLAAQRGVRIPA
ncbi:MAG: ankyrin repeat domain-containing protein, partial [Myxococcaceae bacterium]